MICIPNSDEEYFRWLDENTDGFVVNSDKALKASNLPMIHTAKCGHINDQNWPGYTTSATFKLCSTSKQELEDWIKQTDARRLKKSAVIPSVNLSSKFCTRWSNRRTCSGSRSRCGS